MLNVDGWTDGRTNERTNVRMDGNLHAYVFLLKQVRQQNDVFKGRFLLFQVYRSFANLFFKLSVSTFYEEISKFQQKVQS